MSSTYTAEITKAVRGRAASAFSEFMGVCAELHRSVVPGDMMDISVHHIGCYAQSVEEIIYARCATPADYRSDVKAHKKALQLAESDREAWHEFLKDHFSNKSLPVLLTGPRMPIVPLETIEQARVSIEDSVNGINTALRTEAAMNRALETYVLDAASEKLMARNLEFHKLRAPGTVKGVEQYQKRVSQVNRDIRRWNSHGLWWRWSDQVRLLMDFPALPPNKLDADKVRDAKLLSASSGGPKSPSFVPSSTTGPTSDHDADKIGLQPLVTLQPLHTMQDTIAIQHDGTLACTLVQAQHENRALFQPNASQELDIIVTLRNTHQETSNAEAINSSMSKLPQDQPKMSTILSNSLAASTAASSISIALSTKSDMSIIDSPNVEMLDQIHKGNEASDEKSMFVKADLSPATSINLQDQTLQDVTEASTIPRNSLQSSEEVAVWVAENQQHFPSARCGPNMSPVSIGHITRTSALSVVSTSTSRSPSPDQSKSQSKANKPTFQSPEDTLTHGSLSPSPVGDINHAILSNNEGSIDELSALEAKMQTKMNGPCIAPAIITQQTVQEILASSMRELEARHRANERHVEEMIRVQTHKIEEMAREQKDMVQEVNESRRVIQKIIQSHEEKIQDTSRIQEEKLREMGREKEERIAAMERRILQITKDHEREQKAQATREHALQVRSDALEARENAVEEKERNVRAPIQQRLDASQQTSKDPEKRLSRTPTDVRIQKEASIFSTQGGTVSLGQIPKFTTTVNSTTTKTHARDGPVHFEKSQKPYPLLAQYVDVPSLQHGKLVLCLPEGAASLFEPSQSNLSAQINKILQFFGVNGPTIESHAHILANLLLFRPNNYSTVPPNIRLLVESLANKLQTGLLQDRKQWSNFDIVSQMNDTMENTIHDFERLWILQFALPNVEQTLYNLKHCRSPYSSEWVAELERQYRAICEYLQALWLLFKNLPAHHHNYTALKDHWVGEMVRLHDMVNDTGSKFGIYIGASTNSRPAS
jgi:hypothetical protein